MIKREEKIIQELDLILKNGSVRSGLKPFAQKVRAKLVRDPGAVLAWEPVPLELYGEKLPEGIRSSWVFVVRAGAATGPERHPNSHQRMMSLEGSGDLSMFDNDGWQSNFLVDDSNGPIERRWVSIPANTWHQAVVGEKDWLVISFHTVPAEELIEERPDPTHEKLTQRRKYLGQSKLTRRMGEGKRNPSS